ncbi:MAG: helix-turn-helix domain-containing protein, partial [Cyclobacteriaceae bacterium]
PDTLPQELRNITTVPKTAVANGSGDDTFDLKTVEKNHILKMLNIVGGNKSEAAKKLDIGLATLYRKLKEYGLD